MQGHELIRRVDERIRIGKLFERSERIIAAVSGGSDSIALLHILYRLSEDWGFLVTVAHVNHGLRGEESDEEERYVHGFASALGLECRVERVDVTAAMPEFGNNLQAAARELRYAALRRVAEACGTQTIALGHHADDQAETVLMRLLRGTGPGGLAGIREQRFYGGMKLVRPLLRITKAELEGYCRENGLEFRTDSSNSSRKYFRNTVRLDILPYLMKHQAGVAGNLSRLAELCSDESDWLDSQAEELLHRMTEKKEHGVTGDRIAISTVHTALQRRMFKIILSCLEKDDSSIDFLKIEQMREAICEDAPPNSELRLTERLYFRRRYDCLEWTTRSNPQASPYEYRIEPDSEGELFISGANATLEWKVRRAADFSPGTALGSTNDPHVAIFDADRLAAPLLVRNRHPGDRLEPFGLKGSKKVKDMFIDFKVPPERRELWPVLTDAAGTLLWIPSLRRSRHALVGEETQRVLWVRFGGNFFA
jgi:tRNA(Ile)-lysidine synthase